jgi:hypothetical protein
MESEQEKRMIHYLLGRLSDQEQTELEVRYLADDDCFAELLAMEDELRDAYARGELSAADREAFERRLLLSPQQVRKQEFAYTLSRYLMEAVPPPSPRPGVAGKWKSWLRLVRPRFVLIPVLSACLLVLVAAGWWLSHRSRRQLATASTPTPPHGPFAPGVAPGQAAGQGQKAAETNTVAFVLNPVLVRGPEQAPPVLAIPPGVSRVRLEARFEGNYPSYRAVLETADNKLVWSAEHLKDQTFDDGKRVFIELSNSLLDPGDYILTVRGVRIAGSAETVAEYAFRVARQ